MSNICLSQMIIDEKDLDKQTRLRFPRINSMNSSALVDIKMRKNNITPIDESLRTLFPFLNDQVIYYFTFSKSKSLP